MDAANIELALHQASYLMARATHLVAFVGAGMSVESGIPAFRGPGGLWSRHGEPKNLSFQGYLQDPGAWWHTRLLEEEEPGNSTYELKQAADCARPNPGHYALTELEHLGLLKHTITQNVDNLHHQAGSTKVVQIHGNRTKLRCLQCGIRLDRNTFPITLIPPHCPQCDGLVKIDSVMFGESIPPEVMRMCTEQAEMCDCMLMVGTSGTVQPAASLPLAALNTGASLIEINVNQTSLTSLAEVVIVGTSGKVLPILVNEIQETHLS